MKTMKGEGTAFDEEDFILAMVVDLTKVRPDLMNVFMPDEAFRHMAPMDLPLKYWNLAPRIGCGFEVVVQFEDYRKYHFMPWYENMPRAAFEEFQAVRRAYGDVVFAEDLREKALAGLLAMPEVRQVYKKLAGRVNEHRMVAWRRWTVLKAGNGNVRRLALR